MTKHLACINALQHVGNTADQLVGLAAPADAACAWHPHILQHNLLFMPPQVLILAGHTVKCAACALCE